ncbi:pncA [Mytilus coruscus]|uniref:nicotinamidase n=1 Tax=Mytilus coruscus TaxID=42192 RepID=A0A6J7ZTX3_MYTCO|nr:pncA [Mytilus coruscus]
MEISAKSKNIPASKSAGNSKNETRAIIERITEQKNENIYDTADASEVNSDSESDSDISVDSYFAFYDNGGFRHTELHDKLQEAGIDALIITGLARDYCVYYTAMDAKKLGYQTYVVLDATRPVNKETGDSSVADMKIKGIQIIDSPDVAGVQLTSDAKHLHSPFILLISIILCFIKCVICMY